MTFFFKENIYISMKIKFESEGQLLIGKVL